MLVSPRKMYVVRIGTGTENDSVAIFKILQLAIEFCNFCRTYEREVHGIEKDDRPLSLYVFVANRGELFAFFQRHDRRHRKLRKLFTDSKKSTHECAS